MPEKVKKDSKEEEWDKEVRGSVGIQGEGKDKHGEREEGISFEGEENKPCPYEEESRKNV